MMLQTSELSPGQRAAIEELLGRELSDKEAIIVRTCQVEVATAAQQEKAREKLVEFLKSDRPKTDASDEEFEAAFLEAMRSVRPGFTPMP
jgi:hypothetical protein